MTEPIRPATRRPAWIACAVLAAALVAGAAVWLGTSGSHHPARPAAQGSSTPAPTPPAPSTSSTRPTTAPKVVAKARPRVPHQYVAAAAPLRFVYHGSHAGTRFAVHAQVCGMDNVRPLDPPGEQHHTVCWVQHDFGFAPGSHGRGTTYVLGHSWSKDADEVLNPVSEAAMRQVHLDTQNNVVRVVGGVRTYPVTALTGDTFTLRTGTGTLRYTVRNAYGVSKQQAGYVPTLMNEHTRNRVVLITCGELGDVDYDYNIIVEAYLTSSVAART